MVNFRKKIFIFDFFALLVLMSVLFPVFVEKTVKFVLDRLLERRAADLISLLGPDATEKDVIELMKSHQTLGLVSVTFFDAQGNILYQTLPVHKENAAKKYELFSYNYHFSLQGNPYVFRFGYFTDEIGKMISEFVIGFLLFGIFMLTLYGFITWMIIDRITKPIQEILKTILPYQEGREEFLPPIPVKAPLQGDDFTKLALTLNSLSERIQREIYQLKQQQIETESILESLGEGVIALTTSGRISFANEVACLILGASHQAIIGKMLDEIPSRYPSLPMKGHELVIQVLQTSEPIVQTWSHDKGGRLHLNLIAAPLTHQHGAILVLQDKTSEVKVLEMGKDFIANASHELRTPITVIRGFAETLQDLPKLSQQMLQDITDKIVRTCIRLDKLVKSLLTLSDIENLSESQFRFADLIAIAESAKCVPLAAHGNAEIIISSPLSSAMIFCDPDLIELAVTNLLENAIKYSPLPAKVEIRVYQEGAEVVLAVEDHGIGIPEADLPHIFDRFYTVDKARSRKSGGAGLGLSIVKTVIEKHNGSVRATSHLGKGSCFMIRLPFHQSK